MLRRGRIFIGLLILPLFTGCGRDKAAGPPAVAEKPRVESDLSKTAISAAAFKALGVKSQAVEVEEVQDYRMYSGWITPQPGREHTAAAPVAGYVVSPAKGFPVLGQQVEKEDVLFLVEPVLSPWETFQLVILRFTIEAEVAKEGENVSLAKSELQLVEDLKKKGLRGDQDVLQAQVKLNKASKDLSTAKAKQNLFATEKDSEIRLKAEPVKAKEAGTVMNILAGPGQLVPLDGPVLQVADLNDPWVRVPIPEAERKQVDWNEKIQVVLTTPKRGGAKKGEEPFVWADPVGFAPEVDPVKHTVPALYALEENKELFFKDELVTTRVPLGGKIKKSLVPYSAVVYDAFGGAWVYLDLSTEKEHLFERRRVELGASHGDKVVIIPGLKKEDLVVVEGAGVLFSRDFFRPPVAKAEEEE